MTNKAFLVGANAIDLEFAEADISNVAAELDKFAYSLTRPGTDKQEALTLYDEFIDGAKQADTLIVYFSGHAFPQHNKLAFLIGNDAAQQKNLININNQILEPLGNSKASNKLVVLDCCHANMGVADWNLDRSDRYQLLTASDRLQHAKEFFGLKGGFLSSKFCEYLKEYADDEEVILDKLYEWVREQRDIYNRSRPTDSPEVPMPNLFANQKSRFLIGYRATPEKTSKSRLPNQPKISFLPRKEHSYLYGRELEYLKLREWIQDNKRGNICICGVNGIGKRALVLEFIDKYQKNDFSLSHLINDIVFLSSKNISLDSEILEKKASVSSIEDVYSQIAIAFEIENSLNSIPKEQYGEIIKRELNKRNTLLIIENYTALDDRLLFSYLNELPLSTRCILIGDYLHPGLEQVVLFELSLPDAINLVQDLCQINSINLSERQVELLAEKSFGVPSAIKWSINQLRDNLDFEILCKKLEDPHDAFFKYVFEKPFSIIRPNINISNTLLLMSFFPKGVTTTAVQEILGFSYNQVLSITGQLKKMCLILAIPDNSEERFFLLDSVKSYTRKVFSHQDSYQMQINSLHFYMKFAERISNENLLLYEKLNLIALLEEQLHNDSIELNQLALETIKAYARKFEKTFQLADIEYISDIAIKLSRKSGDVLKQINFMLDYYEMAQYLRKEFDKAEALIQEALILSQRAGYANGQAKAYRNLGALAKARAKYPQALDYFEKALKNLNASQSDEIRIVKGLMSSAHRKLGFFSKARDLLNEEIDYCRNNIGTEKDRLSVSLCRFGTSYLEEEKPELAITYFNESLTIDEALGRTYSIAYNSFKIARCYGMLSNKPIASEYAEKTKSISEKNGYTELAQQAAELLALLKSGKDQEIRNKKWENTNE